MQAQDIPIDDPSWISFEAQLHSAKRNLEVARIKRINCPPYLSKPQVRIMATLKKKIAILENLIALYGGNPKGNDNFVATVYGDPEPYYTANIKVRYPNEYTLCLRPLNGRFLGMGTPGWNRYYVPDGNGRYRFCDQEETFSYSFFFVSHERVRIDRR